jgi:tetratricopeptide (TPR) repeat protein
MPRVERLRCPTQGAGPTQRGRSEREVMVSEPDRESASDLSLRAWELTDLADYAAAVEASAGAIRLDPNSVLAYTVRGWALEGLGEEHLGEARSAYEMALQLDATAPWPRTGIADLLRRTGNREEAERLYRAVADEVVDPQDTRPRSLEFRGWSLYRLGHLGEAIAAFRASLTQVPGRFSVLFDLALALLVDGRSAEAIEAYRSAIEAVRAADVRRRLAPLSVASEDLDDAISSHPDVAALAAATAIRERLRRELSSLVTADATTTDPPDPAF